MNNSNTNQQGFSIEIVKRNSDNTLTNLYLKGTKLIEEQSSRGTYSAITTNNKIQWKTRDIPDICQVIQPILKHKGYFADGCKNVANVKEEPVHMWDLQCRRCHRLIRIYKFKEYFGYYSTNESCNHQEPPGSLPTPILELCMNRADEKGAATNIISNLQLHKDDIQKTRMLFEDPNLEKHPMLNNKEYWEKIKTQIKSKCKEIRRKRKGNNSLIKNASSKKMTRPISSVKQSLENNYAHLEQKGKVHNAEKHVVGLVKYLIDNGVVDEFKNSFQEGDGSIKSKSFVSKASNSSFRKEFKSVNLPTRFTKNVLYLTLYLMEVSFVKKVPTRFNFVTRRGEEKGRCVQYLKWFGSKNGWSMDDLLA